MSQFANVKHKRLIRFLKKLSQESELVLEKASKHYYKLNYPFWQRPFPIPSRHSEVNKHTVKQLSKKLVQDNLCSEERFIKNIK